jgi:hypothetical protein
MIRPDNGEFRVKFFRAADGDPVIVVALVLRTDVFFLIDKGSTILGPVEPLTVGLGVVSLLPVG